MLYFAPVKSKVEFKGFRAIRLPFLGQEEDDKFELRAESFKTTSVVSVGDGEFIFEALVDGPFEHRVTGRLQVKIAPNGVTGRVVSFRMDEHGDAYAGIMTRYSLPRSAAAKAMLKRYDEVFFGGNMVALSPPE
jgi:hypothetical protein